MIIERRKIIIPAAAIYCLQEIVILELAKNIEIQNSLGDDDDGPPGFDVNDIPLYFGVLKPLIEWDGKSDLEWLAPSKPFTFTVLPIPKYLEKNMKKLYYKTYAALKTLYMEVTADFHNLPKCPEWPEDLDKN